MDCTPRALWTTWISLRWCPREAKKPCDTVLPVRHIRIESPIGSHLPAGESRLETHPYPPPSILYYHTAEYQITIYQYQITVVFCPIDTSHITRRFLKHPIITMGCTKDFPGFSENAFRPLL
jgi:hypothetical protein